MGLTAGIGTYSPLKISQKDSGRDVVVVLTCVGTTTSGLITPPISIKEFPGETPSNTQSLPPRPLLSDGYPLPKNFVLPLSGYGPRYSCDQAGRGDILSSISTIKIHPK